MGYSCLVPKSLAVVFSSLLLVACAPNRIDDSANVEPTEKEVLAGLQGERINLARRLEQDEIEVAFLVEAPETGAGLGWGWNTFRAEPIPTVCIEFETESIEAQTATLSFEEVSDTYELMRAMDISATVSVKTIGYQARGAARFAKEMEFSGQSTTYVIEAEVLNGAKFVGPTPPRIDGTRVEDGEGAVRLTPAAAALASEDVELFKETCGNGYISATMDGAKLIAVSSFETSTRAEKEELDTKISGSGGLGTKVKVALTGKFEGSSTDFSSRREISFYQTGGKGQELPTNAAEIIDRVGNLAEGAEDAAQLFQVAVTPYEILENWPRTETIIGEEAEFEELTALWGAYKTLYADIQNALDNPLGFVVPIGQECTPDNDCSVTKRKLAKTADDTKVVGFDREMLIALDDLQDEVLATLDRLELEAENCIASGEMCEFASNGYRSPYAIRAQLPILECQLYHPDNISVKKSAGLKIKLTACDVAPESDDARNLGTPSLRRYVDTQIRKIAKSRCKLSSLTPGCLSNNQINEWGRRVGRRPIVERQAVMEAAIDACWGEETAFDILWGDPGSDAKVAIWVLRDNVETILGSIENVFARIERENLAPDDARPFECREQDSEEEAALVQVRTLHQAPTIMPAEWTSPSDDEPAPRLPASQPDEAPSHYAQLAALSSEAAARDYWARLPSAIDAMAFGLEPRFKSTPGGKNDREQHLVQVGTFGSEQEVMTWCSNLLRAGVDCLIAQP